MSEAKTAYKLATIAVGDESTWLQIDKVDPGFAAKRVIDQALISKAASPLAKKKFLADCLKLYSVMTQKILERCPLKYPIVRAFQALDSRFMIAHQETALEKIDQDHTG